MEHCPARFTAVVHQRSPVTVAVPAESEIGTLADVAGKVMSQSPVEVTGWVTRECCATMADAGLELPVLLPMEQSEATAALANRHVDAVATYADVVPSLRARAGVAVRAIPAGKDLYATGLVANDNVPTEVIARLRATVATVFEQVRADPDAAVDAFCTQVPEVDAVMAREGWSILEEYALGAGPAGAMAADRWDKTIEWLCRVHKIPAPKPETVFRPEFMGVPA